MPGHDIHKVAPNHRLERNGPQNVEREVKRYSARARVSWLRQCVRRAKDLKDAAPVLFQNLFI